MKIKILSAFALLLLVSLTVVYSCKKKSTTTTTSTSTSADYAGTWSTTSKCSSSMTYQMTVTASGASAVVLNNFHANASTNGYKLNATISDNSITISSQTVSNSVGSNPLTFSGSGTLSPPSSLSISYTAKDISGATLSCTATCTK